MTRSFAGACALALLGTLLPALAQAASERSLPMRFELRQQSGDCGDNCRAWISASGAITAESPRDFLKFAKDRELRGLTVALDSDGGSVLGAIALGREFRRLALNTTVGRAIESQSEGKTIRVTMSPRADCGSMCVFVLLGGAQRTIPQEARVMVHQIWLGDRRDDPTAANYSAEDLVLVQRDIGRLAQYTIEMGGGIELLDIALRIPPWEPMHALSRDEMKRVRLDSGIQAEPAATVAAAAPITKVSTLPGGDGLRAVPAHDRRWAMVDTAAGTVLARRHPLTIEGDEIGVFDLAVTCGADGNYVVNYSETRRGNGHWALPIAVQSVSIRVGSQNANLKVTSSERRSASELVTLAGGTVPAALMSAFANTGHRAMMVETTSNETITAIRVGNSGVMQSLPQLAARCAKPQSDRADIALKKTGGMAVPAE